MKGVQYREFYTDISQVKQYLDVHGVAVVPKRLTDEFVGTQRDLFFQELSTLTDQKVVYSDRTTWKNWFELFPMHGMLVQHYGIGHFQSVWNVRQHPSISAVFSELHNTPSESLITSFDGVSLHFPPEVTGRAFYRNTWLHTDQAFSNKAYCAQGLVPLFDVEKGDATLLVLEGSHLLHEEFGKEFGLSKEKDDWWKLTPEQVDWYISKGCKPAAVLAKAGDLVLWDSRTIHQGKESDKDRARPTHRLVFYVCQEPRRNATPLQIKKKQDAFKKRRMTTHWPAKNKLFGVNPRTYGKQLPVVNVNTKNIELSELGLKLCGF